MVKVKSSTQDGKDIMILGLSDINMSRLAKGEPIRFNASTMGLPEMEIIIFNGRTEEEMLNTLNYKDAKTLKINPKE